MKNSNWSSIRKQLYVQIRGQVEESLGPVKGAIKGYKAHYQKEIRRSWRVSHLKQLMNDLSQAQMVFLAEFHALRQSPRSHLRVLRSTPKSVKKVISMECFQIHQQSLLDGFLNDEMSEEQFLDRLKWDENWGFPWENYRPLILWAKNQKIPIFGVNSPYSNLHKRDQIAAQQIKQIFLKHPQSQNFIIFGEWHVANSNLPKVVREVFRKKLGIKNLEVLLLFQNIEEIYFQLVKKNIEHKTNVVKLLGREKNTTRYCLMGIAPWVKWQNYQLFLERKLDPELEEFTSDEDPVFQVDYPDYTDHIKRYYRIIKQGLNLLTHSKIKNDLDQHTIITPGEDYFWNQVAKIFSPRARSFLRSDISQAASFYIPEMKVGFLGRPSLNHAVGLAQMIIHSEQGGFDKTPWKMPDHFNSLIWIEAIKYVGIKMINPNRKTDTIQDIETSLLCPLKKKADKLTVIRYEALLLSLLKYQFEKEQVRKKIEYDLNIKAIVKIKYRESFHEAARLLGGMMGEKIYFALKEKKITQRYFKKWLEKPISHSKFNLFYYHVLVKIQYWPEPFLSKKEKL